MTAADGEGWLPESGAGRAARSGRRTAVDAQEAIAGLRERALRLSVERRYREALTLARRACDLARDHLGPGHPELATCLQTKAEIHEATGNLRAAERLYRQALDIDRAALGPDHPDVATDLNQLALLLQSLGDYVEAEHLHEEAIELSRAALGDDDPATATSLNNLAELYRLMGDYGAAEPLYRRAIAIYRATLGEDHTLLAGGLNNLGELYRARGNYAEAEPLLRQALAIWRRTLGERHPNVAAATNNLALLYRAIGSHATAESLLQQAIEIWREALGPGHPHVAAGLNNLAELYWEMDNHAAAEVEYRRALAIYRRALGAAHPSVATVLNNLAELRRAVGDFAQAERLLRRVLQLERVALGRRHPRVAVSLNNLAELYRSLGRYDEAEPLYREALAVDRRTLGRFHPDYATDLRNLALLLAATDRRRQALDLLARAAATGDGVIGRVFSIGSESQRMAYAATLEGESAILLSLVLERPRRSRKRLGTVFDLILRRKALTAEAAAAQRDAVWGGRHPQLAPRLHELRTLRAQLAQRVLAGPGPEGSAAHRRQLAAWEEQKERLEAELARQIPEMDLAARLRGADRRRLAEGLPLGSALIEFVRFRRFAFKAVLPRGQEHWREARYAAFVLRAREPDDVRLVDLGDAETIDGWVAAYRSAITGEPEGVMTRHLLPATEPVAQGRAADGSDLRAAVFDPLAAHLGGARRLFLAPDGDLNRLPFEILPGAGVRHLIDEYEVSYLSVGRDVLRFGLPGPGEPAPPLVMADPDFDLTDRRPRAPTEVAGSRGRRSRDLTRSAGEFPRLPGTRAEGQRVAALLGVAPLLGMAALEGRLQAAASPRILHVATHGFFLPDQHTGRSSTEDKASGRGLGRLFGVTTENPLLRSGLALAGANTWLRGGSLPEEAGDGILTAEEVSALDLLATELVVLSACDTGLGDIRAGEGVFGLRRAVALAGARTLVMSLWKVRDQQTHELMEGFYRGVRSGEPPGSALRAAQLALRATYAEPRYWGAFIFQGDPTAAVLAAAAREPNGPQPGAAAPG